MLAAYRAADRAGALTLRVVAAQRVDVDQGPEQVDAMIAWRDRVRGKRLSAAAAKIFLDEEVSLHTAAMLAPYADAPSTRGELFIAPAALDALVKRLDAAGFDVHMHAMGDFAARAGLDAVAHAAKANGPARPAPSARPPRRRRSCGHRAVRQAGRRRGVHAALGASGRSRLRRDRGGARTEAHAVDVSDREHRGPRRPHRRRQAIGCPPR